jgi:hypothetical protein
MRSFVVLTIIVGLVGCGAEVKLKGASTSVSGKVSQGNLPVGGVVMIFQPLGDGHVREFPTRKDGTFSGELISGEYAYYIAKPTARSAAQPPIRLSPQYFEADLSRTVTVEPDKQLAIALD